MEVNQQRAEAATSCFGFNPTIDKVHVTSDLKCFPKQNDAVSHARTLSDQTIDVFDRDGEDVEFDATESEGATEEAETIPDHLTAQTKRINTSDTTEFNKIQKPEVEQPIESTTPVIATDIITDAVNAVNEDTPAANTTVDTGSDNSDNADVNTADDTAKDANDSEPPASDVSGDNSDTAGDTIVRDLNHIVDEVEELLHLKK